MYFKSLLTGIVAAVIAAVVWILVNVAISFVSLAGMTVGSGGIGVVVMSDDLYVAAIFGFAMGFYWQFRRSRRRSKA